VTLRVPPVALALPLLALVAFGVIRTEPWRPRTPPPGTEQRAASVPVRDDGTDDVSDMPDDEAAPAATDESAPDPEPAAPSDRPSVQALAETAVDPDPAAQTHVEVAAPRERERADDEKREMAQLELARAREQVEVVVYYAQWCGYCTKARAYLAQRGIRSVEHDVDSDASASGRHRRLNPRGSVPTIAIDGQVLVGFDARGIERALDRAARARLQRERGS